MAVTTPWVVPGDLWKGQVVAVMASGPSLTKELAEGARHLPRIAVRTAFKLAPDADMLLGIDGPPNDGFWDDCKDFAGLKICGTECALDALYLNIQHETITIGPGHVVQVKNNMLAAIRIAALAGANKILLYGCDTEIYESTHGVYLTAGLEALISELRAKGIEVERVDSVKPEVKKRK